jgi:uncharacterized membrane protein
LSASPHNPFSPPSAPVADIPVRPQTDIGFAAPGIKVDAGRGVSWLGEGWTLFKQAPGMWILVALIFMVIYLVISLIPLIGSLLAALFGPVLMVGLPAFAHGIHQGEKADVGRLFAGFQQKLGPLVGVGALYLAMFIVVALLGAIVFFIMIGSGGMDRESLAAMRESGRLGGGMLLMLLVFSVIMTLIFSAYLFAPALVFFANLGVFAAFRESFFAVWRNWLALLVYGLLGGLLALVSMIPFGLGLLVTMPMLMASYYASFRNIFGRQASDT